MQRRPQWYMFYPVDEYCPLNKSATHTPWIPANEGSSTQLASCLACSKRRCYFHCRGHKIKFYNCITCFMKCAQPCLPNPSHGVQFCDHSAPSASQTTSLFRTLNVEQRILHTTFLAGWKSKGRRDVLLRESTFCCLVILKCTQLL